MSEVKCNAKNSFFCIYKGDDSNGGKIAALGARCAGLDRERDQNKIDINELVIERDELQHTFELHYKADMRGIAAWQEATGKTLEWPDKSQLVEWMLSERDALQAKLAAARSAFDSIICLAVEGPDGFGSALKACQAIQKEASAALADTTNNDGGKS